MISLILKKSQILIAIALQIVITINAIYLFDNMAISEMETNKVVAYDIDKQFDRQRKQETQKRYGEKVGEIVDDAIKNNEESSNSSSSQYKIKREDPLNQKAEKFFQQVKDKEMVSFKQQ